MDRRDFVKTGLAAGAMGVSGFSAPADQGSSHFYELRTYELRNDIEPNRIQGFFEQHFLPAMKRLGVGPIGCFSPISGMISPSLLVLIDYRSLGELQSTIDGLRKDSDYMKALKEFEHTAQLPFVRYESALLKAFAGHPRVEVPPSDSNRAPRVFELRTYESKSDWSLRSKLDMFNQEEIKIFKDCGFATVFFGEALCGTRLPHLTYMVGFDSLADREKAWSAFGQNPDWNRIKVKPEWSDAAVVSNIHSTFLRPASYSQIR